MTEGYFPAPPDLPAEQRSRVDSELRYEDVSQDGRLMLLGLPHVIGDAVWRPLLAHHAVARVQRLGILPLLTRLVIEGGDGPISVRWPLTVDGCFQLAHTRDASGQVQHVMLVAWCSAHAPRGRTHGPPPEGKGEPIFVGRVLAEHVFTRPFAAPGERKVTRLPLDGVAAVPGVAWPWRSYEATLAIPAGAQVIDPQPSPEGDGIVFGLQHTDSNQHVNSLVYPRLFLDAALRRFAAHKIDIQVLPRRLEVAYRKPSFAGRRVELFLQAFGVDGALGVVGSFHEPGDDRPLCALQATFTP